MVPVKILSTLYVKATGKSLQGDQLPKQSIAAARSRRHAGKSLCCPRTVLLWWLVAGQSYSQAADSNLFWLSMGLNDFAFYLYSSLFTHFNLPVSVFLDKVKSR